MAEEFRLASSAFSNEGRIPRKYGAVLGDPQNQHQSPPVEWYNVPEGTESLALVVENVAESPDSPVPFVHWVVVNIPPTLKGLPSGFNHKQVEGQKEYGDLQEGVNDSKVPGYRGPAPVGWQTLEFRLYALDCKINLGKKVTKDKLVDAMEGHILGEAKLVGHFNQAEKVEHDKRGFISSRFPAEGQSLYHT